MPLKPIAGVLLSCLPIPMLLLLALKSLLVFGLFAKHPFFHCATTAFLLGGKHSSLPCIIAATEGAKLTGRPDDLSACWTALCKRRAAGLAEE
jgi:hypothetical protein